MYSTKYAKYQIPKMNLSGQMLQVKFKHYQNIFKETQLYAVKKQH